MYIYVYIYIRSDRGGHRLAVVTNNIYIYIYHQAPRLQGRALRLTWTKLNCTRTRLHNVTTVDVHMSVYIYIYIYSVCIYIYMAITSGDTTEYIYIYIYIYITIEPQATTCETSIRHLRMSKMGRSQSVSAPAGQGATIVVEALPVA